MVLNWIDKINPNTKETPIIANFSIFLFISIGIGLSIAGTSIISQLIGADKIKEANEHATQLIVLTVLCAVIFTVIGYITTPYIVKLMGA
ncbi:MATE family efflux transporter, partial [Vibrio parahaemolyticus]|nr:MATE family efflux transporter [Vibrio parahaemolyticus]